MELKVLSCGAPRTRCSGNPFNGIESHNEKRQHRNTPPRESIQWNWKISVYVLAIKMQYYESIQWNWKPILPVSVLFLGGARIHSMELKEYILISNPGSLKRIHSMELKGFALRYKGLLDSLDVNPFNGIESQTSWLASSHTCIFSRIHSMELKGVPAIYWYIGKSCIESIQWNWKCLSARTGGAPRATAPNPFNGIERTWYE